MAAVAAQHARVLSGMRPTGRLHLGHYHGVLKNWIELQHEYQCFFFVADWHALTTEECLQELGTDRQVLCVTHLPQVASLADQHFRISKVTDGKTTRTQVHALDKDERIEELARMLGGVEITRKTLEHAAEMLAGARRKRA